MFCFMFCLFFVFVFFVSTNLYKRNKTNRKQRQWTHEKMRRRRIQTEIKHMSHWKRTFKTCWTCFANQQVWRIVRRTLSNIVQRCKQLQHHNTQKQPKRCDSCRKKSRNIEKIWQAGNPWKLHLVSTCFYHVPKWTWKILGEMMWILKSLRWWSCNVFSIVALSGKRIICCNLHVFTICFH